MPAGCTHARSRPLLTFKTILHIFRNFLQHDKSAADFRRINIAAANADAVLDAAAAASVLGNNVAADVVVADVAAAAAAAASPPHLHHLVLDKGVAVSTYVPLAQRAREAAAAAAFHPALPAAAAVLGDHVVAAASRCSL